jgi:phosphoserine aminotransferase
VQIIKVFNKKEIREKRTIYLSRTNPNLQFANHNGIIYKTETETDKHAVILYKFIHESNQIEEKVHGRESEQGISSCSRAFLTGDRRRQD